MGHEVERLALAQGHEIVVTIDNEQEWTERLELLKKADVAIEFSQPGQAFENINRCFDLHLPIVVGTTAWYDRLEEVRKRCLNEGQSLFYGLPESHLTASIRLRITVIQIMHLTARLFLNIMK